MALWAKAQQLPPELVQQVTAIYGEHFPLEVRHVMAPFIERHMWNEVTPGQPEQEAYAADAVAALLQEMQKKAECMTSNEMFLTRMALLTAAERFQDKYNTSPVALYKHIQHCLYTEMQLVNGADALQAQPMACETKYSEIITTLDNVRKSVSEAIEDLRKMEAEQESFALQYHECTKHKAHMQTLAGKPMTQERRDKEVHLQSKIDRLESSLSIMVSGLFQAHLNLVDKLEKNIASLNMLQCRVLDDELISWKREQQLSGNGAVLTQSLNTIQEWCEHLADLIWQTRQQVKEAERIKQKLPFIAATGVSDKLPQADKQVTRLLTTLVTSTFVIEKQPPQVMKTNTRFTSTVRLLVGGQLNVFMTPPQVKVIIISESQAQALVKNEKTGGGAGKQPTEMCGEILNNTGCMEYQPSTRQLSVSFRNMQLRKIKRAEKKGTESVMDEKLTLLFQSQFNVGGGELVFHVWTLSLPVVVIVHGNQEPHGWATVTWDNAFSAPGRIPFVVPDKVSWRQMADTLNLKFNYATGHPLSEDNLRFLAEKVFRTPNGVNSNDLHMTMVTWSQFCKEPLQDRNFTFWEWFYMVMKVTREHLRGPWGDGLIVGFIRKKQAEDMLAACPVGTFLLRFSDSEPGGVTIAWVGESQRGTGQPEVFSLQPFSSRDLQLRALGDRIADLAQLTCLYPDIPKDQAFGKYYSPPDKEPTSKSGYVKPVLVTHLPGWSAAYGSTPHHATSPFYNSPDSQRDTPSVHSSYGATPMPCYAATPASHDMEYELSQQVDSFDEYELEQLAAFDMGAPDASTAAHAAMLAALLPSAGLQRPQQ